MAYTRPSASAADASWSGAPAYTRPSSSAANAAFISGSSYNAISTGPTAHFGTPVAIWDQFGYPGGFPATQYGTPTNKLLQPASGFAPVLFGTPDGLKLQRAEGFSPTQFGSPRLLPFHVGPGIHSTQFGTLSGQQRWRVVPWNPVARLGTPTTSTDRTQTASGLRTGALGTPLSVRRNPPNTAQRGSAFGTTTTRFGAPRAGWLQTGQATGATFTHLGTPNGTRVQHADGLASGALGTATAGMRARALGSSFAILGTPVSRITQPVAGLGNMPRWGRASATRSHTHNTYGFVTARVGHPTGFSRITYPATGFTGGYLGEPTCRQRHRILAIPPCGRFGAPLLKRTTQC